MKRPVDAIVTGFGKSPVLAERSLAPLRALKQEGIIRSINYVTWNGADLDAYVAPIAAMDGIAVTRVAQPDVTGTGNQRGVAYQVKNLEAALALVPDDDAFIFKSRPDFVIGTNFLRRKLTEVERWGTVESRTAPNGIVMPAPVFQQKLWVPWADSSSPFFCEDAAFAGRRADIKRLVTTLSPQDLEILSDADCGFYAHVVRYAKPFLSRYGLFAGFLRNYRVFVNTIPYRTALIPIVMNDGFFWHLLIAHAWILHSQFHVDAGEQGDIVFYANNGNESADWSKPDTLRIANPYDKIAPWREGTKPGLAMPSLHRTFGRLMDDTWQKALFTQALPDLPAATLATLMENIAASADGRLASIEREFYARVTQFRRMHGSEKAAA